MGSSSSPFNVNSVPISDPDNPCSHIPRGQEQGVLINLIHHHLSSPVKGLAIPDNVGDSDPVEEEAGPAPSPGSVGNVPDVQDVPADRRGPLVAAIKGPEAQVPADSGASVGGPIPAPGPRGAVKRKLRRSSVTPDTRFSPRAKVPKEGGRRSNRIQSLPTPSAVDIAVSKAKSDYLDAMVGRESSESPE